MSLSLVNADKRTIREWRELNSNRVWVRTWVAGEYVWMVAPDDQDAPPHDPDADAYEAEQLALSVAYPD